MTGKKKYFYLIIIAFVCVLSMALTCNQCNAEETEDEKIGVGIGETIAEEEITEEEVPSTGENGDEDEEVEPTINLEIYEGPTPAPGNICYYRVEALVTGDPEPEVEFSKDDSNGSWGPKRAQVNLEEGGSYTLTATAKNSEGTAEDSIKLTWECNGNGEEEDNDSIVISEGNNYPRIIEIKVSATAVSIGEDIEVEVIAEDPDGDDLSYKWLAAEGSFKDKNAKNTEYKPPNNSGNYIIAVQVFDGNGGIDTESKTILVED